MGYWLHTESGHAEVFNISNAESLRSKSANFLMGREKELYAWVGATTYQEFMTILRKEFGEAEGVKKALENFKKSNLIINLGLPSQLQFVNQPIEFTLMSEESQDIVAMMKKELNLSNADFVISVEGEPLRLSFDYNESYIKAFLNAYFNGQRTFIDRSGSSRSDKTNPLRHANKAFRELASTGKIGDIVVNKRQVNEQFTVNAGSGGMKNNFEYKKEDIDKAIKDNSEEGKQLKQAILNSRGIIHDTLLRFMNGIPDLINAFNIAWNAKMGGKDINEMLSNFTFFAKGANLNAGVSGAVQELYTAIIAEYINIKLGHGIHKNVADVLGNIAKGGEQPKTDVQILGRIGIQVKAYSMNRVMTKMATNIHPNALGSSLAPYGNENIADTIVQMVFNSSVGDYRTIADQLEPALAQLMNMTTSEYLTDTICFYMVDGQYLVPGSVILETLRATEYEIKIRTSHAPKSDADFNKLDYDRGDGRPNGPAFLQYFNGEKASFKSPFTVDNVTNENYDLYDALMSRDISIDVKFDYSFMGASQYSIY